MARHPSDSSDQLDAEIELIQKVAVRLGCFLKNKALSVGSKQPLQIDGYSESPRVLCEAYARIGVLKPAQSQKVSADILKMLFVEKKLGGQWKKVLAFADEITAKPFLSGSWHAKVVDLFGIEVMVVSLEPETRKNILEAQRRQNMKNVEGAA